MLLVSLLVMLIINHKLAVPATGYFFVGIVLQLVTCIVNTFNAWANQDMFLPDQPELRYRILIITTVLQYTLQPVIIMIVAFIVISKKSFCLPCRRWNRRTHPAKEKGKRIVPKSVCS